MAELSWAGRLVEGLDRVLNEPVSDEEAVLKRFKRPSVAEVEVVLGWLIVRHAGGLAAQTVVHRAMVQAVEDDEEWLGMLRRGVNQAVRERWDGWDQFDGNWVELREFVEQVAENQEEEAPKCG